MLGVTRRTASRGTAAAIVLALAGMGVSASAWPEAPPPLEEPGPETTTVVERGVRVASVVGKARVRSKKGKWRPLEPGVELAEGDEIQTAVFSEVVLRSPSGSTIDVTPETKFVIGEDDARTSRFTLNRGRVAADIRRETDRTYEFGAGETDAKADTAGGEFSLVSDGEGLLGVVTTKGKVGLTNKGKRVVVSAGKQAVAARGLPPTDPLPIPTEILLQVRWPEGGEDVRTAVVKGKTSLGNRVRLGRDEIDVDEEGNFEVEVTLEEGENEFVLLAEDAMGTTRRVEGKVVREPPPVERPDIKVGDGNIWE